MNRKGRGRYAGSRYGAVSQGQPYVSRLHANTIRVLPMYLGSVVLSGRRSRPRSCTADMCCRDHADFLLFVFFF